MNIKNRGKFGEDFFAYIQWKEERGDSISISNVGWHLEQASWIADVLLGLFWVLIKKNVLNSADIREIFWHGKD